jgi:hypothetical protein
MLNFRRITMGIGGIFKAVLPMVLTVATGGAAAPLVALQQMAVRAAVQIAIQKIGQELGLPPAIINMAQTFASSQMGGAAGAGNFDVQGSGRNFINDLASQFSPADMGNVNRATDELLRGANGFTGVIRDVENRASTAQNNLDAAIARRAPADQIAALQLTADTAQNEKIDMNKFITDQFLSDSRKEREKDIKSIMNGKGSLLMKLAMALGSIADQKMTDMATKAEQMGKFGEVKGKNQGKFQQLSAELQALGQELSAITSATSNVIKSIGEGASTLARK